MKQFPELSETHDIGMVSIENIDYLRGLLLQGGNAMLRADLGIQISTDGRVWICLNGRALLRFKPAMKTKLTKMEGTVTGRWVSTEPNMVDLYKDRHHLNHAGNHLPIVNI